MNDKLKFIDLQTFSWDQVMNHLKRYRRVFDRYELTYLGAELSFYNKWFDEKDWEADVRFEAFLMDGDQKDKEICRLEERMKVTSDVNIMRFDKGWGNDTRGKFWEKGIYCWDVYVNNHFVATTKFYIEDAGRVTESEIPYFEPLTLRTYEAPEGDVDEGSREYLKVFSEDETRYIMAEFKFANKLSSQWLCELFFNFYEDTGQHVGTADLLQYIVPDESSAIETYTLTAGWGSKNKGTWLKDLYYLEVVFMDKVVATIPFEVGDKFVERENDNDTVLHADIYRNRPKSKSSAKDEVKTEEKEEDKSFEMDTDKVETLLADLDGLIGLTNIKTRIREHIEYIRFRKIRKEKGFKEEEDIDLHSVFTGNPGTGKTTVVKKLGEIYHAMGLLSKGHVHEVESSDLIAAYIGQTGKDTKKHIEKARGGILFIDEAYNLFKADDSRDFGKDAIAAIITEMSDGKGDLAIMVAGYPKEMDAFINSNPGLRSRFKNHFHFDDYLPEELVDIAKYAANKQEVILTDEAVEKLEKIITKEYRKRDRTFGNARFVYSLVDEAKLNMGIRLVKNKHVEKLSKEELSTITGVDVEDISDEMKPKEAKIKVDEEILAEALSELDDLTGLLTVKQTIRDMIKLVRYYNEIGKDLKKAFSPNIVFSGNPGTGKTTVARIIGKVYKALGVLERGHLIDADGSDLIAGYVGQSALKTKELIEKAMGGILFIDEAYSITSGRNNDFGKKSVATLIKYMEDKRGELGIIAAGYPKNMKEFLESNPGLRSRFDTTYHFEDFSAEELYKIAVNMLKKEDLEFDKESASHIMNYLNGLYLNRNQFFGNARSVRKIIEKTVRNQNLRMASLKPGERTAKQIKTVIFDDVDEFKPDSIASDKKVGFRFTRGNQPEKPN